MNHSLFYCPIFLYEINFICEYMVDINCIDVTPQYKSGYICSYLVDSSEKRLLIETGPMSSVAKLLDGLADLGYSLSDIDFIIVTHIHLDHAGSVGQLVSMNRGIRVYVHPRGLIHLNNPIKLWSASKKTLGETAKLYGEPTPVPMQNLYAPKDGEIISIDEDIIKFIYTPGHASHHMSIFLMKSGVIFTGDSAGINISGNIIPVTPPPHNPIKAIDSLRKMINLHPRRIAFTHFGLYDGLAYLERALNKWVMWTNYVSEWYNEGLDVATSYRKILDLDEDAVRLERFYNELSLGNNEILISIDGLFKYYEWVKRG